MRRLRLRWRLALSHALLAILLVAFAGNRIHHEADVAEQAQAATIAVRDSEVLAVRASRLVGNDVGLQRLVADEQTPTRKAQLLGEDNTMVAGVDVGHSQAGTATINLARSEAAPAYAAIDGRTIIAASPVIAGDRQVGVAVVLETVADGAPGTLSLGVSPWLGALVVALAALAGWMIAGRISRPIGQLADGARQLALGGPTPAPPRTTLPEIETLAAAVSGLADRDDRIAQSDDERRNSLRALSHRLSHQLRTPLTVLRLRLDDITDPALAADRREVLTGVVVDQIDRIDGVADELAQLDPGRWELRKDPVDLAAICAAAVGRHAPLARCGGVTISFEPPSGSCMISGDHTVLDDAVGNVVQNAVKYTPRGGRISVTTARGDEWVTVSDTGPGIGPGERDLVLRPGVRGSAGRRAEGSGHGLALVADAVHRHGGQVELADTPGGGTTVRLLLPPLDRFD